LDRDELEGLLGTLLELRSQFRKLQWYGEVNRRGFTKITKKLDKKLPGLWYQQNYLASKVDPKPFATNFALTNDMKEINDWLSVIGDVKSIDDGSSINSASSARAVSSRVILNLPPGLLEPLDQAIRNDDSSVLAELILEASTTEGPNNTTLQSFQKLLLGILQRCISYRSKNCIDKLLSLIETLNEDDDIDNRNPIHRIVISIGRSHKSEGNSTGTHSPSGRSETRQYLLPIELAVRLPLYRSRSEGDASDRLSGAESQVEILKYLLGKIKGPQRTALITRDSYGRFPLHYAAEYGLDVVCEVIISYMQMWDQIDHQTKIDPHFWRDHEKLSPLHLAVMNGHVQTTKVLLDSEKFSDKNSLRNIRPLDHHDTPLIAIATENNFPEVLELLLKAGFDVNQQDIEGETALHIAARFNYVECTNILLNTKNGQSLDLNIPEDTFGWTPLLIASTNGQLPIVEILLHSGADFQRADQSGWTAKEHAALRGFLDIAQLIGKQQEALSNQSDATNEPHTEKNGQESKMVNNKPNGNANSNSIKPPRPVKTFGHRYLTDETMILISLGSMDTRKQVDPVNLDAIPMTIAHLTRLDTALSVVVSAVGTSGEPSIIDLPPQENISTEPITFLTNDLSKVKLIFDIVPTYTKSKDKIIGRAVALLSSIKQNIGVKRVNLQGDLSVPVLAADNLEVIGRVNFNFLVITPFSHPNMSISETQTFWKSPVVIGHRGLGKNVRSNKSLQLGENTIPSFIAAAKLGASYVEFDVQLTKDHVPVIYHDFLVSETGIDAPVHTLTLEQFLHLGESQTPRASRQASPRGQRIGEEATYAGTRRLRSYSAGSDDGDRTLLYLSDRMKHTRTFKEKGWKANMYGNVIKAPFTTLEEMLKELPESIGFNIEMKYPMLFESEDHEMDTYGVELNTFVDTVLTKVYDLAKSRHIIFSSFHPDICLMLAFKQPSIPVLFLTDAGASPAGDIRAQTLQQAIRFASRWDLLGIVSAAEPLVMCPRLVRVVKESGLVCVSYGVLNNEPENVKV
jgi:glycerophosphodiester phosphodiesterase